MKEIHWTDIRSYEAWQLASSNNVWIISERMRQFLYNQFGIIAAKEY